MQYGNITDYVVLGIRYPTGTVFDCTSCILQANWWPNMKPNKANSLADVESGDGNLFLLFFYFIFYFIYFEFFFEFSELSLFLYIF